MKLTLSLVAAAALAAAMPAQAVNVANQTPQGEYTSNVLGGTTWTTFTAMFDAVHTRSALPDFTSLAGYDAVWVDQELGNALSDAEVASLAAFVGSGHKAVLIGENYAWEAWNASLYSLFETRFGQRMVSAREKIRAVAADRVAAETLGVAEGTPVLLVERIAFTYGGRPVEWRRGLYLTTDHHYLNELN